MTHLVSVELKSGEALHFINDEECIFKVSKRNEFKDSLTFFSGVKISSYDLCEIDPDSIANIFEYLFGYHSVLNMKKVDSRRLLLLTFIFKEINYHG